VITSVSAAAAPATMGAEVTFRETGLAPRAAINVVVTADGFADYGCADPSGRLAGPSLPVTGQVSALSQLHADAAGELGATLRLAPPPPSGIECRPDQRQLVTSARYTHLELSDVTNRVRAAFSGQVSTP
jgi:ABC-type amino acid transport substrate-binding protein